MRISVEELNAAYTEVNKLKINGYGIRSTVDVYIERNPLTEDDEVVEGKIKLTFELDPDLGPKGSYVLASDVDIIGVY
jgi:hypothetical protein